MQRTKSVIGLCVLCIVFSSVGLAQAEGNSRLCLRPAGWAISHSMIRLCTG
jgi:hypothetical protein